MDSQPAATTGRRRTSRQKQPVEISLTKKTPETITIPDTSDDGPPSSSAAKGGPVTTTTPGRFTRSSLGKGKAPVRDVSDNDDDEDDDDKVPEYDLTSEEDMFDEDEDDFDSHSVISVSSDTSQDSQFSLPTRPWKTFTKREREQWELMYVNVSNRPVGGSWETTENYQRCKDEEMQRYLEDHPLDTWVIPRGLALNTYHHALERSRWRTLGIPIYRPERVPDGAPPGGGGGQMPSPMNPSNRQPQSNGPRPTPPGPPGPPGPPPGLHPQHQHHPHAPPHPQQQPPPPPPPHGHSNHAPHPNYGPSVPGPQGFLQHSGRPGPPQPLPGNSGPTQHYVAQPMGMAPGMAPGMGRPIGPPQTMPYGMPPNYAQHHLPPGGFPPSEQHRRPAGGNPRPRRETPVNTTPPPPPPTPPYAIRARPGPVEKKENNSASIKANKQAKNRPRRQAEAEEFPWTRQELNFHDEKAKAAWDDSIYDADALKEMEAVRNRNVPIIDDLDAKVQEQQRIARQAKKNKDKVGENGEKVDDTEDDSKDRKRMQRGQRKGESGGDPYHSGAFAFASDEDEQKAADMGFKTPDDAIEAGRIGKLAPEDQVKLKICWNPGKKGMTENLEQVKFSVKDTVATRKQLDEVKILTHRAAECIIDFCPDLLWRGMLLRICSEGGHGNKDVRDRFCYNGCYCDKATITKRISAALGQKQQQPKSKGYGTGEWEWYEENVKDFAKYIDYFGKRSSHRNMLKIQMQGEKRKAKERERAGKEDAKDSGSGGEESSLRKPRKRAKVDDGKDTDDAAADTDAMDVDEDGHESDGSEDSNAVSVQDSDILDKMED